MGCDGGTIPKRHELCKTKKKPEQMERSVVMDTKWKYCALSNQILKDPIVACELGRFYNKDAVIEYLLDKKGTKNEKMSHIKGLRDIHVLSLHTNPAWDDKAHNGGEYIDDQRAQYICPVAGIEMNGRYKFCFLMPCKCVFSNRALKQVDDEVCPTCSKPYSKATDVVVINPEKDDENLNRTNMKRRKEKLKAEKKKRKEDKAKFKKPFAVNGNLTTEALEKDTPSTSSTKTKSNDKLSSKHVKDLAVTGTVIGAKRKINEEVIFKTESFKSLFTTHQSAKRTKNQQSHWVTYNPYH